MWQAGLRTGAPGRQTCPTSGRRDRFISRENAAGGLLASLATAMWNAPSKSCTGGAVMEEPMAFEYGRLAVLAGPDRESFAVMSPTAPEDGHAPADR